MENRSDDEVDELEELLQKHRKEKKELQGKIQALKKSASKGDKKKKKEVTEEIARLELEITQRHENEISELKVKEKPDTVNEENDDLQDFENLALNGHNGQQRISKAQKRRNKKVTQLKERELRILEQDMTNLHGARHIETEEIKRILKEKGLMISEIPSDGNCLYNAIIHRLKELDGECPTLFELRSQTAEFLRKNQLEFLPYLSHPDTGNMLTESQYAEYCDQVADTTAWGGEVELRALSHVLKRPLEVIQAKGPVVLAGEEYKDNGSRPITLTYHRHMYGLGEHYNSVTQFKDENEEEFS